MHIGGAGERGGGVCAHLAGTRDPLQWGGGGPPPCTTYHAPSLQGLTTALTASAAVKACREGGTRSECHGQSLQGV